MGVPAAGTRDRAGDICIRSGQDSGLGAAKGATHLLWKHYVMTTSIYKEMYLIIGQGNIAD
jgi:hypothetical protein